MSPSCIQVVQQPLTHKLQYQLHRHSSSSHHGLKQVKKMLQPQRSQLLKKRPSNNYIPIRDQPKETPVTNISQQIIEVSLFVPRVFFKKFQHHHPWDPPLKRMGNIRPRNTYTVIFLASWIQIGEGAWKIIDLCSLNEPFGKKTRIPGWLVGILIMLYCKPHVTG